jgi:hypothetical protein
MDRLRQPRSDHIADIVSPIEKVVSLRPGSSISVNNPGGAALRLVRQAAELLRSTEEHSVEVETRARALIDRAVDELKEAKKRVHCLELDCNRLYALLAKAEDRALATEGALRESEARISAMEIQLSKAELRASEAEGLLTRVKDAIRNEILQPNHTTSLTAAA